MPGGAASSAGSTVRIWERLMKDGETRTGMDSLLIPVDPKPTDPVGSNPATPVSVDSPEGPTLSIGPLIVSLLIVAPATMPALSLWAGNVGQFPKAYRLLVVSLIWILLGLVLFWLARRLSADNRLASFATFFMLLALTSSGQTLQGQSWLLRWVIAFGAVAIIVLILHRLRRWWLLDVIVIASAAALFLPPLLTGVWKTLTLPEDQPVASAERPTPQMAQTPDIVLVVVDGYASLPVLRELFSFEDVDLPSDLAESGMTVVEPAFAPYPMTHLSVSSLLELDYSVGEKLTLTTDEGRTLGQIIGGDSYLVDLLSNNGYRTTMVEPGWHFSTCGPRIDVCVSDPFVDEGVGAVLSQSLVWSFLEPSLGSGFTNGAMHAMRWATSNVEDLLANGTPDFIFVHVLAPHPPVLLDASCKVVPESRRPYADELRIGGVDPAIAEARLEGYVGQVQCVNHFVRELARSVAGSDSVVLVTGDHGSDAQSQLETAPADWSDPQIVERMSVFLAMKAPSGCENPPGRTSVSILRSLVSCAGGLDLDPIEDKSYLTSLSEDGKTSNIEKLDASDLDRFAACMLSLDETLECS